MHAINSLAICRLRVGYRLLKNAGFVPPELALRKEIRDVEQLLAEIDDLSQRQHIDKRLRYMMSQLGEMSKSNLWLEQAYYGKVQHKLVQQQEYQD